MEREIIETVKKQVLEEASHMREINKVIPVSGERFDISLKNRSLNIILYKAQEENRPLILGFHGGGYLFGGNAMNDAMWCAVCDVLNVNVASVEYRKSPDYRWKEALDDAYDCACYMEEHADLYKIDKKNISVMGCSAGANLAATVCLYAKKQGKTLFKKQILMYPELDGYTDPDSKGDGSIQGPVMYIFNELHATPEEAKLSIVSPVFATEEECKNLPPAIFVMADHDCLKKESYDYAGLLKKYGVSTSVMESKNMPHGFFESGFGKISDDEMNFLGEDVKKMIKSGQIAEASKEALEFVKKNF